MVHANESLYPPLILLNYRCIFLFRPQTGMQLSCSNPHVFLTDDEALAPLDTQPPLSPSVPKTQRPGSPLASPRRSRPPRLAPCPVGAGAQGAPQARNGRSHPLTGGPRHRDSEPDKGPKARERHNSEAAREKPRGERKRREREGRRREKPLVSSRLASPPPPPPFAASAPAPRAAARGGGRPPRGVRAADGGAGAGACGRPSRSRGGAAGWCFRVGVGGGWRRWWCPVSSLDPPLAAEAPNRAAPPLESRGTWWSPPPLPPGDRGIS
jgi:hypothetical protein